MLSERELEEYSALSDSERGKYLITKWSAKEAMFKTYSRDLFVPRDYIPTLENTSSEIITVDGRDYAISVAHGGHEVEIKFIEDLK